MRITGDCPAGASPELLGQERGCGLADRVSATAVTIIDSEVLSPPIGEQLRASTSRLLSRYLIQRDSSLLLKAQQQPLDRINNVLTSGGTLLPGQDIPAVLELELRIKELHKGPSGVAFRPKTLSYFQSRDEVAFESTRAGCQQFMDIKASELKLRCILPEAAARSLQSDSGGVGNRRLIAQVFRPIGA
jgi:hypothetical protein